MVSLKTSKSFGLYGMGLDEKAIEAVEQWRFKPGIKNGEPVAVKAQVAVSFRLYTNPPFQ